MFNNFCVHILNFIQQIIFTMKSKLITKFKLFNFGQYIMIESCGWNDTTTKRMGFPHFFFWVNFLMLHQKWWSIARGFSQI